MRQSRRRTLRGVCAIVLMVIAAGALAVQDATAATVNVTSNITTSQTWTKNNDYMLTQPIYVTSGATLTIEPGTVVRGEPDLDPRLANDPGTLIITRGSKIRAIGTTMASRSCSRTWTTTTSAESGHVALRQRRQRAGDHRDAGAA